MQALGSRQTMELESKTHLLVLVGQPTRILAYGIQLASLETTSSFEFLFCRGISRSRSLRNKVTEQLPQRPFEPTQVFWKVKSIAQNVREMTKEGLFIGHGERNEYREKHKKKKSQKTLCVTGRLGDTGTGIGIHYLPSCPRGTTDQILHYSMSVGICNVKTTSSFE